jgi:hypothetical protein
MLSNFLVYILIRVMGMFSRTFGLASSDLVLRSDIFPIRQMHETTPTHADDSAYSFAVEARSKQRDCRLEILFVKQSSNKPSLYS